MKNLIVVFVLFGIFTSCNDKKKENNQALSENKTQVDSNAAIPELSIYNLPSTWTTQDNQELKLEELRGNVLVVTMIYTSCTTACPRLIADMRNIESKLPVEALDKVKFVIVSIDPETDTPERLKEFSERNNLEDEQWVFLRGTPDDTREFATVLAVSYKQISPLQFSHSNIISVFDEQGVLVSQKEGLGMNYGEVIAAITEQINN